MRTRISIFNILYNGTELKKISFFVDHMMSLILLPHVNKGDELIKQTYLKDYVCPSVLVLCPVKETCQKFTLNLKKNEPNKKHICLRAILNCAYFFNFDLPQTLTSLFFILCNRQKITVFS